MVDYTIYVLDENDLTTSSSTGLDGVTQGDGSHLNGETLTINTPNWTPITIRDDDVNFSDNDSSQRLDGAQEVNGTTYADGTRLEAEYSFEATFDGQTWTLIAFNVVNSSPSYGTIEGIAVIGGPGDFPPPGVTLQLNNAGEGPNFAAADYATPICFDAGCPILTPEGYRPVEELRAGDYLQTADNGAEPILWAGSRRAFGVGPFAPVEVGAGALGNDRTLRVSQQHRILMSGPEAELLFGASEVLVPARALFDRPGIRLVSGVQVHYHHILLPSHAIVDCAGMATESFLPSTFGLSQVSDRSREELRDILAPRPAYRSARPVLRAYEAALLAA
ncbi:MAG: Hint domain-containing protein [Pseudomonadota bacterium]